MKKGFIHLTLSLGSFIVSGYLINIFLGRFLGPSSYGVYGVLISLMGIINIIQTGGIPLATAKFIAEDDARRDSILKSSLILQLLITLLITISLFLLAKPLSLLFNDPKLTS